MIDYNKRLVEVDEILNYLSEEELSKIPEEIKASIKENKDKDYIWKYDEEKPLKDQKVDRDTIAILSYLNIEYLLNTEQKELMLEIHKVNQEKQEQMEINKKYGLEDVFKKEEVGQDDIKGTKNSQELSLVENKDNFFVKIIKNIKKIFGR